ncbi:MAG TPA: hypothetical protein VG167_18945 [Verrucomicrobiae bacterium]|nr:hypothetical protein [Verrucomicrobiae bacterium]
MLNNGIPVNFGFTGTGGITCASAGTLYLQNADESVEADKEDIRGGLGDILARVWFDQHLKATLECIISGTGIANAVDKTSLVGTVTGGVTGPSLTPGTLLSITACASMPDLVLTTWEVMPGTSIKGSNTTAKRMTLQLEYRAGITAVAAA